MTGESYDGKQSKGQPKNNAKKSSKKVNMNLGEIEYLLFQSTQGIHFAFDNQDIAEILKTPVNDEEFFTLENMEKIQDLLSTFIEKKTIQEKKGFLERLSRQDYSLFIRAYFQLVENTILAHSNIRH